MMSASFQSKGLFCHFYHPTRNANQVPYPISSHPHPFPPDTTTTTTNTTTTTYTNAYRRSTTSLPTNNYHIIQHCIILQHVMIGDPCIYRVICNSEIMKFYKRQRFSIYEYVFATLFLFLSLYLSLSLYI
jgi:hypothetical protein